MHKYLRSIGFEALTDRRKLQEILSDIINHADRTSYTAGADNIVLVEFCKSFGENIGIAVCGEFDENNQFIFEYYYPYLTGTGITTSEDITVERHSANESYAGVCDDIKLGVTLIFYLQNVIPYVKAQYMEELPIKGTTLTLAGLAEKGTIMMPIQKNEREIEKTKKASKNRTNLLAEARMGNEEAIETLTLEDMDMYTTLSKKIQKEDVFSLVDTYFMPYGVECDQYSVLGEIKECNLIKNTFTGEEVYEMTILCNELIFDICINKKDLFGEPAVSRRFKGTVWMQGHINYPDVQ